MAQSDFKANNFINHPYKTLDILQRELKKLGFTENDWKIREKGGFEFELPRVLKDEERDQIYQAYADAENDRKKKAGEEDEE